jgi:C4-dicarboxylate transporter DctM subunit
MSFTLAVVSISFGALIILLAAGIPIALAMGSVGFIGFVIFAGLDCALESLGQIPHSVLTNFLLVAIPLFILMGSWAVFGGITRSFFDTSRNWLGSLPGGVGISAIAGAAGFAAVSGSSVATAAAIGKMTVPEMRRLGYSAEFASGCVAAGGTFGIMIPPSGIFIIYGWLTDVSVGKMFVAGILPGLLSVVAYIAVVLFLPKVMPGVYGTLKLPPVKWSTKLKSLTGAFPMIFMFTMIMGGIYGGIFTPTEAAAIGALFALFYALGRRRIKFSEFKNSLLDAASSAAMIGFIIVGAMVFSYYLALTGFPVMLSNFLLGFGEKQWITLAFMLSLYFFLGAFMDTLGMVLLTIPIFFPIVEAMGYDPIWFGVIVCKLCEIALITPPIGINVFVIAGIDPDMDIYRIFRGIIPFLAADLFCLAVLIIFPQVATFLPSLM